MVAKQKKEAFSGLKESTQRFYAGNNNSNSINGNCLVILRADMDPHTAGTAGHFDYFLAQQCDSVTLTVVSSRAHRFHSLIDGIVDVAYAFMCRI